MDYQNHSEAIHVLKEKDVKTFIAKLKEKIKKRKWVWNEEKFGSKKARNMFNEIFLEIEKEIDKLAGKKLT